MAGRATQTVEDFFRGRPQSRRLFDALRAAVHGIGPADVRVTKSQIAFRRGRTFAWAWVPGMYLRGESSPLVLTLALRRRDSSKRWKEIVEPVEGRFTHHLELRRVEDVNAQVRAWLREAWAAAGQDTAPQAARGGR